MLLLESKYLLVFIKSNVGVEMNLFILHCYLIVFIGIVFIHISSYLLDWIYFFLFNTCTYKIYWGKILFWRKGILYWENNAYMYWVEEQLCIKLSVAEAACAASAYLKQCAAARAVEVVKVLSCTHKLKLCDSVLDCSWVGKLQLSIAA